MVRSGAHPLDAYNIGPELPKASAVLGRVVQTCFLYFGSYRTINTAKFVPANPHTAVLALVQQNVSRISHQFGLWDIEHCAAQGFRCLYCHSLHLLHRLQLQ